VFCLERVPDGAGTDREYTLRQLPRSSVPHTNTGYNRAIRAAADEMGRAEVVHSHVPATAPALAAVGRRTGAATVLTLNAYAGVCPKNDLLHLDREHCTDNSTARCVRCLARTSPGHDEFSIPYRLVRRTERLVPDIDGFRTALLKTVRGGQLSEMSAAARMRAAAFELETVVNDIATLYASLCDDG
jgi:hypothetical protein